MVWEGDSCPSQVVVARYFSPNSRVAGETPALLLAAARLPDERVRPTGYK